MLPIVARFLRSIVSDFHAHCRVFLVFFTMQECKKHWGTGPSLHVANQYAQWLDSDLNGAPDNAKVWAACVS